MNPTTSLLARLMARIAFAPEDGGASGGNDTAPAGGGDDTAPAGGGNDTAPAGGGNDTVPAGGGDDDPFSWFGSELNEDDKAYLEAKNFKAPKDLYKSLRSAEKMIRGDRISGPPEDPEKHGEWLRETGLDKRLGIPEEATGYDVQAPDFDDSVKPFVNWGDERQSKVLEKAHELNMTPQQVQGMLDLYAGELAGDVQAHVTEAQADEERMQAELKREWGDAYDTNLTAALEVAKETGLDENKIEAMRSGGLIGSTELTKLLHEVAQFRGNDTLLGGGKGGGQMTREQAEKEFNAYKEKHSKALLDRDHPEHASTLARYKELMAAAGRGSQARR